MTTTAINPARVAALAAAITAFLQERLKPKLEKLAEDEAEERQRLLDSYTTRAWVADAAHRVGQLQLVTHAVKFTHPDAKGSNLYAPGNPARSELLIGTHSLGANAKPDVVGNAAALDVYKFLQLEVEGSRLLELARRQDPDLAAALADDPDTARQYLAAFARIAEDGEQPASHKLAKQIYWPLDDGGYHLLAPLFPSSLVHQVWQTIRADRFSDMAKAAREARKAEQPHPHGYREHPELAVLHFGGSKPQNISQLNSERYGENYLLPALPPAWQVQETRPPLGVASIFGRPFGYRVQAPLSQLRKLLLGVQKRNSTLEIRQERDALLSRICDELLQYAAELQNLPPGWSQAADCQLHPDEQCWLDPERAGNDPDFAARRARGEWQAGVSQRFGNWLNARLEKPLTMDQASHAHWAEALEQELALLRLEIAHD